MPSVSTTVVISGERGLHARPIMAFAGTATRFASDIAVSRVDTGETVDGKSVMAMLTLMLTEGTAIRIQATGGDAREAVQTLVKVIDEGG